tara:strand:- start:782 stop:1012 length:231 start_codon:yes stop_codon:yes gene_type:complete
MPYVKPLGNPKPKPVKLTKVEKNEVRAKQMVANVVEKEKARKRTAFVNYMEGKLLKGHSQKDSKRMAEEMIYGSNP